MIGDYDYTDWEELIEAAIRYRLGYQMNSFLARRPYLLEIVPDKLVVRLSQILKNQLYYNFAQISQLQKILLACEKEKIQVILLKGLWLVEYVYRDPKARLSGDIDLLVRPEDMPAFTAIAKKLNYVVPSDINNLMDLAPASNEYALSSGKSNNIIDLHWSLTRPFKEKPIDEKRIWDRSESIVIGGVACKTLSLEDHLLYLCFHTAIHHKFVYVGPRALLDIACLIDSPPRPIAWKAFVDQAREFKWSRGVWLTLDLVRENLGVSPPEYVLTMLAPINFPSPEIRESFIRALFMDQFHNDKLSPNIISLIDASWSSKIGILFSRMFPSKIEIATQYGIPVGSPFFLFYYGKRLLYIAFIHLPRIMQIILKNPDRIEEKERMARISRWLE